MLLITSAISTLLLLSILPMTLAFDCTESRAIITPPGFLSHGSEACVELCQTDVTCFESCYGTKLKARAISLTCTGDEACLSAIDELLCVDFSTGEYHDSYGGNGNWNEGVYTLADGQVLSIVQSISTAAASEATTDLGISASIPTVSVLSSASAFTPMISDLFSVAVSTSTSTSTSSTPSTPTGSNSSSVSVSNTVSTSVAGSQTTIPSKVSPTFASIPTSGGQRLGCVVSSAYGILGLVVGILVG